MKRLGFSAFLLSAACCVSWAAPVQQWGKARVKRVKIYPEGVYVTMSVRASLKGAPQERVIFPDLWYADRATVEVSLAPGEEARGVTFVPEVSPAAQPKNVSMYRQRLDSRKKKQEALDRLRSDSAALEREADFLESQSYKVWKSLDETKKVGEWLREQFPDVYEKQRRVKTEIVERSKELAEIEKSIVWQEQNYGQVTLTWVWVEAPEPREVEFEMSYYTNAAAWEPVYFFRFDSERNRAELDYQATLRQWTTFNWDSVDATLSYGLPRRMSPRRGLHRQEAGYVTPTPTPKRTSKFDGILDLNVTQEMAIDMEDPRINVPTLIATEADVSYRLAKPLSLVYSSENGRIFQTVQVRRDTIPVSFAYEVTPKVSDQVVLMAYIPRWRQLYLRDGRMSVFCDGRMLGQSSLSVRSAEDTLSVPLTVEPLVVVDRREMGDYKEKLSGKRAERKKSFEIRVRNNKEFPVTLTVKDQYPVPNTDEVEVALTESSGALADSASGMLTWKLELEPGAERVLKFGYAVRYPKDGKVYF